MHDGRCRSCPDHSASASSGAIGPRSERGAIRATVSPATLLLVATRARFLTLILSAAAAAQAALGRPPAVAFLANAHRGPGQGLAALPVSQLDPAAMQLEHQAVLAVLTDRDLDRLLEALHPGRLDRS